jgi:hypothetical protein
VYNTKRNSRKLSFYYTFKKNYKMEEYLNTIKDPSQRRMFAKFRISDQTLLTEYGRYQNIPVKKDIVNYAAHRKSKTNFTLPSNVKIMKTLGMIPAIY